MTTTNEDLLRNVEIAAVLRVNGCTWEQVAGRVDKRISTVRGWSRRYRDDWLRFVALAREDADDEAFGQARHILRHQLASRDDKQAYNAARVLLDSVPRRVPPVVAAVKESPFFRIAKELESMSHEQLCR